MVGCVCVERTASCGSALGSCCCRCGLAHAHGSHNLANHRALPSRSLRDEFVLGETLCIGAGLYIPRPPLAASRITRRPLPPSPRSQPMLTSHTVWPQSTASPLARFGSCVGCAPASENARVILQATFQPAPAATAAACRWPRSRHRLLLQHKLDGRLLDRLPELVEVGIERFLKGSTQLLARHGRRRARLPQVGTHRLGDQLVVDRA